ncbi:MAG: hypothetical protein ACQERZ_07075 [Fusobacteriota bacterium]
MEKVKGKIDCQGDCANCEIYKNANISGTKSSKILMSIIGFFFKGITKNREVFNSLNSMQNNSNQTDFRDKDGECLLANNGEAYKKYFFEKDSKNRGQKGTESKFKKHNSEEMRDQVSKKNMSKQKSTFSNEYLVKKKTGIFKYKTTKTYFLLCFICIAVGALVLYATVNDIGETHSESGVYMFAGIFMAVGLGFWVYSFKKKIFDFNSGIYWTGFKKESSKKTFLKDVCAIQILGKSHRTKNSANKRTKQVNNYELNLVLNNLERVHVTLHTDYDVIQKEASKIADKLNIPVWDEGQKRFLNW